MRWGLFGWVLLIAFAAYCAYQYLGGFLGALSEDTRAWLARRREIKRRSALLADIIAERERAEAIPESELRDKPIDLAVKRRRAAWAAAESIRQCDCKGSGWVCETHDREPCDCGAALKPCTCNPDARLPAPFRS